MIIDSHAHLGHDYVSDVFQEDNPFNIGVCINRTNEGYQSLEDVHRLKKEAIRQYF